MPAFAYEEDDTAGTASSAELVHNLMDNAMLDSLASFNAVAVGDADSLGSIAALCAISASMRARSPRSPGARTRLKPIGMGGARRVGASGLAILAN